MDAFSFVGNTDPGTLESLYQKYLKNPDSVNESWRDFFKGFDFALKNYSQKLTEHGHINNEFKVLNYIRAFRKRGHLFTQTNPVRTRRKYMPTLDLENYELSENDLDTVFQAGQEIGIGPATLREIRAYLMETYCESIGSEFLFIRNPDKTNWLQSRIEKTKNKTQFTSEEKKEFYNQLNKSVGFENFIHRKFIGQKRFSLEGTENLIPALYYLINKGADLGISEYMIGMSHRGRLNVLANILQKPAENIFQEFIADSYEDNITLGDVKYHLGYNNEIEVSGGQKVKLNLAPNPSHLEAVYSVIQGLSRARIDHTYRGDFTKLAPIIIHGDAAIAGQGVVYEVIQMSDLSGYRTGGTIHIVINNQVGFTTNYLDARTSTYCTDVGKVIKAPIFHVNGDDLEALVHTVQLAMEYRQNFYTDVFIDILSYRKHGHNEGDEPRYTQPTLYKAIANHPNPRDMYGTKLIKEGIYKKEELQKIQKDFDAYLEEKLTISKQISKVNIPQFLADDWKKFKFASSNDFNKTFPSDLSKDLLRFLAEKINYLPPEEKFIKKTIKLVQDRKNLIKQNKADWALAELLAYGSLVYEGHPVRISGQDSVRGTFAHRHAAHIIEDTDKTFTPLKYINKNQASFNIYNSPLNEYGVLGFEYGYALANPNGLTVWEAQFGDFNNVAQVIIDQYISSAEEKWGIMNGIVLYLPHGYEGQGPEHSSARIERFLSLAANNNIKIVNPTTPSNMFHVLRQQIRTNFRVPLIVFTPKSLLRHPSCMSALDDLAFGDFQPVIDDSDVTVSEVSRLVFCTGKIYYDFLARKEALKARDIALVRIEQLHPFPGEEIRNILNKYNNKILTLWVQEEPENMGAWRHIHHEFKAIEILPVARQPSGSPATGLRKIHQITQNEIINKVFRPCICEHNYTYCGLKCADGSIREKILKQYRYLMDESALKPKAKI